MNKKYIGISSMLIVSMVTLIMAVILIIMGIIRNNNPILLGFGTNLLVLILGIFTKAPRFAKERNDLSI